MEEVGPGLAPTPYEGIDGRGTDLDRLVGLSDGVFAFAMTLLVISLALPALNHLGPTVPIGKFLAEDENALLGYALAFMVVAAWWSGHHRIFSAMRRYDSTLMHLNNLFLLLVSVTPFTLALVFVYGPSGLFSMAWPAKESIAIFAGMQTLTGVVLIAIWRHATAQHRLVDPSLPDEWIRFAERETALRVLVFGASFVVAFVLPLAAEFIWVLVLVGRHRSRPPARGAPPTSA